ncbi:hypothetical protein [Microvirga rosea]|uniref:hypothetical protein n=1 Tax=Microvirga rosea TaxID=2715425 RepID=UPI001D09B379|nr:hypothetical protein [Microvirga rosea]MCB8820118.1 hypothetical protein [Microvirga rosea]
MSQGSSDLGLSDDGRGADAQETLEKSGMRVMISCNGEGSQGKEQDLILVPRSMSGHPLKWITSLKASGLGAANERFFALRVEISLFDEILYRETAVPSRRPEYGIGCPICVGF